MTAQSCILQFHPLLLPKETPADPSGRTGSRRRRKRWAWGSRAQAEPAACPALASGDRAQGRAFGDAEGLVEANTPWQVKHTPFNGVLELVMYVN